MNKRTKDFQKALKAHRLELVEGGKHYRIEREGKLIATFSHTGEQNCIRQCVRDLVRAGVVPESMKRLTFS